MSTLPWVFSLLAIPTELGPPSFHNCVSPLLKKAQMPPASLLYSGAHSSLPPKFSEVGGDYFAKLKLWVFALKTQTVFLLNRESRSWYWAGCQDKGKIIWGGGRREEFNTLLQILDFIFTANVQYKNHWLDFSVFVEFKAAWPPPAPPPAAAAHPAVVGRGWRPLFSLMWFLTAEILKHWKTGFIMEMLTDY